MERESEMMYTPEWLFRSEQRIFIQFWFYTRCPNTKAKILGPKNLLIYEFGRYAGALRLPITKWHTSDSHSANRADTANRSRTEDDNKK